MYVYTYICMYAFMAVGQSPCARVLVAE